MARVIHKLTASSLTKLDTGFHSDGGGLYLTVGQSSTGNKSWVFRFARNGKQTDMGMGPFPAITLSDARERAAEARRKLAHGIDPMAERKAVIAAAASVPTFQEQAEAYISAHKASWRPNSLKQWESTLSTYAYPSLGKLTTRSITTANVLSILSPIWATKNQTADRVRNRIESVWNYAKTQEGFTGENPARWRGHLDQVLPRISGQEEHHSAVPVNEIAGVMAKLESLGSTDIAALALRFVILTASRGVEVRGMKWSEIDLATRVWTVPASRMKAKKEHRVALSAQACAMLIKAPRWELERGEEFVFSLDGKKPISADAMLDKLASIGFGTYTVHGMRSTFCDWRATDSRFNVELQEAALAHVIKDKVQKAYQRTDLLEQRFPLMQAWADHVHAVSSANVIVLKRA